MPHGLPQPGATLVLALAMHCEFGEVAQNADLPAGQHGYPFSREVGTAALIKDNSRDCAVVVQRHGKVAECSQVVWSLSERPGGHRDRRPANQEIAYINKVLTFGNQATSAIDRIEGPMIGGH